MFEQITLGVIQGIAEWLPVSSEGLIVLAKTHLFKSASPLAAMIQEALFLHLGTWLAALIYFRQDVARLVKALFRFQSADAETKKIFQFLLISSVLSGCLGIVLLKIIAEVLTDFAATGRLISLGVGLLLLITAFLEIKSKGHGYKDPLQLKPVDGILLGIAQGLAALPGLSRSGLTVSVLLLRKFDKAWALRLSFLMSLIIVLAGNIILNFNGFAYSHEAAAGFLSSFLFGLATIHLLLKIAQKINFGYFVLFFGLLTIASAFL